MNGRQRARWYADQMSDLQRLQKQTREVPAEAVLLGQAQQKLREARDLALASASTGEGDGDHGES